MFRKLFIFFILVIGVVTAQTQTPQSTIQPMPAPVQFDPTSIIQSVAQSTNWTQAAGTRIDNLGKIQFSDEQKIAANTSALDVMQDQIMRTRSSQTQVLFVIPTSLPVGWSSVPITVTEFQGNLRTRRIFDFMNVHQLRICQNISSVLIGGVLNLEQSIDQVTWTTLTNIGMSAKGLSCSGWVTYGGVQDDSFIRITGNNPLNSTTGPSWWYISMEVR